MYFDEVVGLQERLTEEVNIRQAVRGMAFRGTQILLVVSRRGDYKMPGGGIKRDETHHEALAREMAEETGYQCTRISSLVGRLVERRPDIHDEDKVFEMISYYYVCEVSLESGQQALDAYELELGFRPAWIDIQEAIRRNEEHLKLSNNCATWTRRENYVLSTIQECGINEFWQTISGG